MRSTNPAEVWDELYPYAMQSLQKYFSKSSTYGSGDDDLLILLHDVSKGKIIEYSYSSDGFDGALGASANGDVIIIPAGTIPGNHTIADGVMVICDLDNTIFTGTLTVSGKIVGGWLQGNGQTYDEAWCCDSGHGEALTIATPLTHAAGMHFYTRTGSNYVGWYFGKGSGGSSDTDLYINYDDDYGTALRTDMRLYGATGQFVFGADAPLIANAGSKIIVVGGEISIQETGSTGLILNSGVGGTAGYQYSYIDFKINDVLIANVLAHENGNDFIINSSVANNIRLVEGGGKVGVNRSPTTHKFEVGGNIYATGIVYAGDTSVPFTSAAAFLAIKDGGATGFTALSYGGTSIMGGYSSGGTKASPSALADDGGALWISAGGYDGVNWYSGAYIKFVADEAWSAGHHGTRIELVVTDVGAVTTTNALILYNTTAVFPGTIKTNSTGTLSIAAGGSLTGTITSGKTLTLTCADNYNLTIPATGTAALGTGTANYLTKWSATNTVTNSIIRDDGTTLGIGTAPAATWKFQVDGVSASGGDYGAGNFVARKYRGISTDYVTGLNLSTYEYANTDNGATSTCRAFSAKNYYDASATYTLTITYGYGAQINTPTVSGAGTVAITTQSGFKIENQGNASIVNAIGLEIANQSGASSTNFAIKTNAGNITFNAGLADDADFLLNGTTYSLVETDASDDELYLVKNTSAKLSFHNVTPVIQQVLATGASHTVDDVITFLQTIGLCKQS